MRQNRSIFFVACALPLSLVACGSSGNDSPIIPEGTHYGYVVSKADTVPAAGHAADFGVDLGSKTSATLDGKVDNQLGEALSVLSSLGFNVQGTVDTAISHGSIILLVDFQTKNFVNTNAAGLSVKFGTNPTPSACSSPTDTTCGHHLDGTASFQIAADSPNDTALAGKIVNGTFTSAAGDVSLQLAIGTTTPIEFNLLHARAKATTISETGMSLIVGGLLTQSDLMTKIGPAIKASVDAILATNCTALNPMSAPKCGCAAGSTGEFIEGILDGDLPGTSKDCNISVEEILGYPVVAQLLTPDSCSKDSCSTADALSIGVKVQAVKATFPMQ